VNLSFQTPILAYPFRPFFLLTGIYGIVTVLGWIAFLFGTLQLPLGWSPVHWHSHEMLFGLIPLAIAGFLLTAVCNWTGAKPLQGKGLLILIAIWLAGRFVIWTASWWPAIAVAIVDCLFMPLLAVYMGRVLWQHGNKRNIPIVIVLTVLSLANLMMHIGFINNATAWLQHGEQLAMSLIMLLMIIIGGRIIPLFTNNWLRNQGLEGCVKSYTWLDRATLLSTLLYIITDFFIGTSWLCGFAALAAGLLNTLRLIGWSGWRTAAEPLLWILHLGYESGAIFNLAPASVWQHALGAGAMGTLILGVMTRVALGHTGRPLKLPRIGLVIYAAITLAAVIRVIVAMQLMDYRNGLLIAAISWSIAFAFFTWVYWPILTRSRVDGRPG
jgi:uncharacterized protein involved in response to NO